MYHSLTIKTFPGRGSGSLTIDTYKDLYLVPTSLPVISTPGIKTKTIEIPGANGMIDLTESLTPYPVYKNRTGSLEFALLQDRLEYYTRYKNAPHRVTSHLAKDGGKMWAYIYSDIMNKIHGRRCQIILEDDPEWYYEGRLAVNQWKSSNDGKWPIITLNYDLAPYKLSVYTSEQLSSDNWLWNPFSFIDGVIYNGLETSMTNSGLFVDINVNSDDWVQYTTNEPNESARSLNRDTVGWMPVSPTVYFSSNGMGIKIVNPELGYTYEKTYDTSGYKSDPECILYDYLGNGFQLYLKGHGTATISFRKGSL